MKVKFRHGAGSHQELSEWSLPEVPRKGEYVQLDRFKSGYVDTVMWVLGDDNGFPATEPYVVVVLR